MKKAKSILRTTRKCIKNLYRILTIGGADNMYVKDEEYDSLMV